VYNKWAQRTKYVLVIALLTLIGYSVYNNQSNTIPLDYKSGTFHTLPVVDTIAEINKAVVLIEAAEGKSGSGTLISKDGWILTAGHVIKGGSNFAVSFKDGRKYDADYYCSELMNGIDIGFIKIDPNEGHSIVPFGDSDKLRLGDDIYIFGCPLGRELSWSVTKGIISGLERDISFFGKILLVQADAQSYPGNSGGPLIKDGKIVGIKIGGCGYWDGISLCVPGNIAKIVLEKAQVDFKLGEL